MSFQSLPTPPVQRSNSECAARYGSPDIRFHLPYQRLQQRKVFSDQMCRMVKQQNILRLDNFALFDAVAKRGGFQQVASQTRWQQIALCLQYEKKMWGYQKYYQQVLLPLQTQFFALFTWYSVPLDVQTLQMHLLPSNNLTTGYYHLTNNEYLFADAHFFSLDQYFNIKTLVLSAANLTRIPPEYAEKYIILKKWLLFAGQLRFTGLKDAKMLGIRERIEVKVVIIGLSLASLLVADRLSQFGVSVVMVDKGRREGRTRDEFQVVENGVMLLEGGNTRNSYARLLEQSSVMLTDVAVPSNGMPVLDEQGKPYAEERIRVSEEHFFGIIEELRGEVMSRKNLYEEVVTRMLRRKLEHQRFLIRWHYDRYMTFNRLKGDATTVADLAAYDGKKFAKHIAHSHSLSVVLSVEKLISRVRQRKNVTIVHHHIDHVSHNGDLWTVHTRAEPVSAQYLIYADQQAVFRGVLDGSPKLQEFSAEVMGDSLGMLQQLTVMKYINCHFRFRQKLLLKQPLKNQSCFSICCAHGFVYFFVLNNGTEILAVHKCYHTSNINYYSQIFALLESKCLVKNNRLVNEDLHAYEYTFGVKDEKYMQGVIKIKRHEKMCMLLPITTTNCPHRMAALIDLSNYITATILDQIHPNYHQFDPTYKDLFKNKEAREAAVKKVKQFKKKQSSKEVPSVSSLPNFPSNKSVSEESQCKIKIVTVTLSPNTTQNASKFVDNQLPSVLALNAANDDWFGLKHSIVRSHEQFIKNRIQSCPKLRESLSYVSQLALTSSIALYRGTYLLSFGHPLLWQQDWFSCLLPSSPPPNYLFLMNGFVTRREFLSLSHTLQTTIYFQTIMMVDHQVYYVIVDENNPTIKYYHNKLTSLIDIFSKKLDALRNEQLGNLSRSYNELKINRCRFEPNPPSTLLPSTIEQTIREQLKHTKETSLDAVLQQKLQEGSALGHIPTFMNNDVPLSFTPIPPVSPLQIYKEICAYIATFTTIHELRPLTLFEIFFGWLNEQYMACEIMRRFTTAPLTYFDLEKMDEPLCKQIQQIFSKNVANQLYALFISPQENAVYFHRNFLHPNNRRMFYRYTYLRELGEGKARSYIIDEEGRKVQVNEQHKAMIGIISKLTQIYQQEEIVDHFQRLVNQQFEAEINLSPRMKAYYRMTKKSIPESPPPSSITKLMDKCRNLNEEQKTNMFMLMKRGRIRWVNGEMLLIHK